MERKEIKAKAKEFAFQNKWKIWKPTLIIVGISVLLSIILNIFGLGPKFEFTGFTNDGFRMFEMETNFVYELVEGLYTVLILPITVGIIYYIINIIHGKELEVKEIFSKYKFFVPIIITYAIIALFTFLWGLLLIIPGIIYYFKVSMVPYILAEEVNEDTKHKEVIDKSKKMMEGHKWEYFVFNLSFIGWVLLSFVTFGIALIWTVPYIQVANVMYFEKLKELNK